MAITVTKNKAPVAKEKVEVVAQDLSALSLEDLADQYGSLSDKVEAANQNPVYAQFALIKKELDKRLAEELEPQDEAELKGAHWLLEIGACSRNPREITDIGKIAQFVGAETFAAIASVSLKSLDSYLTPEQIVQVVKTDTGYQKSHKVSVKFIG